MPNLWWLTDFCAEPSTEAANCTKREEMSYCDGDKPKPRPPPTPAECTARLHEMCDVKNATESCEACAERLGKEHGCTKASEQAACSKTPPTPPKPAHGYSCDAATKNLSLSDVTVSIVLGLLTLSGHHAVRDCCRAVAAQLD